MYFSKLLKVFLSLLLLALAGDQEHQLDEEQDAELLNIITMMQTMFRCLDAAINNAYMVRSLLFTFFIVTKIVFTIFLVFIATKILFSFFWLQKKSFFILILVVMQQLP